MKTPRSVDIDITRQCNLRCAHCYHFGGPGDVKADLSTQAWLSFFETIGAAQVMEVTLAGGEPFLRSDLKILIEGIVQNRMRYSILTNGTLITDDMAAFLHSTGRVNHVQVSIDGSNAHVHDRLRGDGAFEKSIAGIERLKRNQVPVTVRVTIHRGNHHDLEGIAQLLFEDLNLPGFSTNSASCLGLGGQNQKELSLSVAERRVAMKTLSRLNHRYQGRITAQAGPLAEFFHFREMIASKKPEAAPVPGGGGFLTGCGCVFHKIAVNADGSIVPCVMLSHMKLGHIGQDDFIKIWRTHPDMVAMRERQTIPLSEFDPCRECEFMTACTGNCPGIAFAITGKVNFPSPDACLRRYLKEGGSKTDFFDTGSP